MQKRLGAFWACLAIMYLLLAGESLKYSLAYDSKISKAPTMPGQSHLIRPGLPPGRNYPSRPS